jgi:hypothetical protein
MKKIILSALVISGSLFAAQNGPGVPDNYPPQPPKGPNGPAQPK